MTPWVYKRKSLEELTAENVAMERATSRPEFDGTRLSDFQLKDLKDVAKGTRWTYPPTEGYILSAANELLHIRTKLTLFQAIKLWWEAYQHRRRIKKFGLFCYKVVTAFRPKGDHFFPIIFKR